MAAGHGKSAFIVLGGSIISQVCLFISADDNLLTSQNAKNRERSFSNHYHSIRFISPPLSRSSFLSCLKQLSSTNVFYSIKTRVWWLLMKANNHPQGLQDIKGFNKWDPPFVRSIRALKNPDVWPLTLSGPSIVGQKIIWVLLWFESPCAVSHFHLTISFTTPLHSFR